jgi:hypothetical protein
VQARTGVESDLDRNAQTVQRGIDSARTVHKFTLYFRDFQADYLKHAAQSAWSE